MPKDLPGYLFFIKKVAPVGPERLYLVMLWLVYCLADHFLYLFTLAEDIDATL